ncbi:MAG TPA: amino acid-binding protein [Candidatus Binatia bacterium]|nr:amino acid-binding protein [Candidatus Binatia bacterium]
MATDLTVILRNVPGTIADAGEAAGKAGVNIDGLGGFECGGEGVMHVLVEDGGSARQAFEAAGLEVRAEREVLVVDVADRPGEMGRTMRRLADADINVDLVYLATDTRLVIGPDDLDAARAALAG